MRPDRRRLCGALLLAPVALTVGCADPRARSTAVYMLVDMSGTYVKELDKAQQVVAFLLGTMNAGDSLAVARVKSRSFSEKEIIAKATFDKDPIAANTQKRQFKEQVTTQLSQVGKGSTYTDLTGGVLQAAEYLRETGAGRQYILLFSDMQEELDKQTTRDVPLDLKGIRVVAINVTKLDTDNMDPNKYLGRLQWWEQRVKDAGASDWRMVNNLEHLERVFGA